MFISGLKKPAKICYLFDFVGHTRKSGGLLARILRKSIVFHSFLHLFQICFEG